MLRIIARLLRVLNSETDPTQISLAFALSMVAGLTPLAGLHNLFVVFLVLVLRVNISAFILGLAFFSGVAYLLDPLFHAIGLSVLTARAPGSLWTALYNITFFRMLKFYNSILMGSLLLSLALFVPFVLVSNRLILKYREHLLERVRRTRVMQILKATKLYRIYSGYSRYGGGA